MSLMAIKSVHSYTRTDWEPGSTTTHDEIKHLDLFKLPLEVRRMVYGLILIPHGNHSSFLFADNTDLPRFKSYTAVLRTCRQIYIEALPMLYTSKIPFVFVLRSPDSWLIASSKSNPLFKHGSEAPGTSLRPSTALRKHNDFDLNSLQRRTFSSTNGYIYPYILCRLRNISIALSTESCWAACYPQDHPSSGSRVNPQFTGTGDLALHILNVLAEDEDNEAYAKTLKIYSGTPIDGRVCPALFNASWDGIINQNESFMVKWRKKMPEFYDIVERVRRKRRVYILENPPP